MDFIHIYHFDNKIMISEALLGQQYNNQEGRKDHPLPSSNDIANIDPDHYQLTQNYFTKEQLMAQIDYQLVRTKESLYFGGFHNGLRHGFGVVITPHSIY